MLESMKVPRLGEQGGPCWCRHWCGLLGLLATQTEKAKATSVHPSTPAVRSGYSVPSLVVTTVPDALATFSSVTLNQTGLRWSDLDCVRFTAGLRPVHGWPPRH